MSVYAGPTDWWLDETNNGRTHTATKVIVQSGLVFNLDAGVSLSYPGTGTSSYNISNLSNVGNLAYLIGGTTASGTTYSPSRGGIFVLDGVNDYIDFGTLNLGIEAADKTICMWVYPTALKTAGLFDRDKDGAGGYGFWMNSSGKLWYWPAGFGDVVDNGPYALTVNTWSHVAVTYTISTKTANFYYNGLLGSSRVSTGTEVVPVADNRINIGAMRNAGEYSFGGNFFQGNIGPVNVYNRILSATEIRQNFNALRGRFGI